MQVPHSTPFRFNSACLGSNILYKTAYGIHKKPIPMQIRCYFQVSGEHLRGLPPN